MGRLRNAWRALRGEAKASAVGPLIVSSHSGRAVSPRVRLDDYAAEGYVGNVIAFRAVTDIAQSVASCAWLPYAGDVEIDRASPHPLAVLLRRANPAQSFSAFVSQLVAYRLLAGNAYIERVLAGGAPRELYSLRPDRVSVVPGNLGVPSAYDYRVSGATKRFDADPLTGACDVLHLRNFHPLDDFYGLSPLQPAACSINQHNASGVWNQSLLANGAKTDGAFTVQANGDGSWPVLTPEQRTQLLRAIDEKMRGPSNAGETLVLDGGLKYESMSMSPRDMDWLEGRFAAARDIAMAFGYPPMLLGLPGDQTFANAKEARLSLWENTVVPLAESIADDMTEWLAQVLDDDSRIVIDTDAVSALSSRREEAWARVGSASFLTINEKRTALGYEPIDNGDELLVPAGLLPIGFDPPAEGAPKSERVRWYKALGHDDATALAFADAECGAAQ